MRPPALPEGQVVEEENSPAPGSGLVIAGFIPVDV